ncbi:MAG: tRNA pseudouridine(38-40) synthase TruA, partial [Planctomycetota bacterium]
SAAGRTDAGVHAAGQAVSVATSTNLSPRKLTLGLNAALPEDVVVRSVEAADDDFHATRDAVSKRYRYALFNDRRRPLFLRRYVWHVPTPLDIEAMRRAAHVLVGKHDFASFQSAGSARESTVRTILAAEIRCGGAGEGSRKAPRQEFPFLGASSEEEGLVCIDLEGDGFLYNMVRSIAGTLVKVGRGRRDDRWVRQVLAGRDRRLAGQTAPPHGLTLMSVRY